MAIIFNLDNPGMNTRLPAREVRVNDGRAELAQAGSSREFVSLADDKPVLVFPAVSLPGARVLVVAVGELLPPSVDVPLLYGWAPQGDAATINGRPNMLGRYVALRGPSGFTGYIARADELRPAGSQVFVCVSGRLPNGEPVRAGWIPPDTRGRVRDPRLWSQASRWMLASPAAT